MSKIIVDALDDRKTNGGNSTSFTQQQLPHLEQQKQIQIFDRINMDNTCSVWSHIAYCLVFHCDCNRTNC